MALPPSDTTNDTFVREVDEEYRRDQMLRAWKKWGRAAIVLLVVALVAFAGYLFYLHRGDSLAGTHGEQLDNALRDLQANQPAKAEPVLRKLATDGGPGYRAMARFNEGEVLLAKQDLKGAAARFAEIAADAQAPQPFRDRALIQQTVAEFDTLQPQAVIDRLKPLATADSPWFGVAGELVAAAYLKQGKRAEAGKLFGQIAQSKGFVPETIRQRAVQMAGVLGVDAIDQTEVKKTQ